MAANMMRTSANSLAKLNIASDEKQQQQQQLKVAAAAASNSSSSSSALMQQQEHELQFIPLHSASAAVEFNKDAAATFKNGDRSSSLYTPTVEVAKAVTEYPLPGARETHEMAVVADKMLVVSQQTNSTLVKMLLDPSTGRPVSCAGFLLKDFWAGLHGLTLSHVYRNQLWATLQFRSMLIRIDPKLDSVDSPPVIIQQISLPDPAKGPHSIVEYDSNLWTCCKDSSHIVRFKPQGRRDFSIYKCSARPIFIVQHPTSLDMYATLDISSKIWRLKAPGNQNPVEIDIPSAHGRTPVGLVAGTDGNVWFTLLGDSSGGLGTFARILQDGAFQWFSLSSPIAPDASLIHLAFDQAYLGNRSVLPNDVHRVWLLSSTLIAQAGKSIDAIFSVLVDTKEGRITTQESIVLPTQRCAPHRVLAHGTGLFVSQMLVSSVAHITGAAAFHVENLPGAKTDFYAHFGLGQMIPNYNFSQE